MIVRPESESSVRTQGGGTRPVCPQVYYDITNLVACLDRPTPTGIDRIDLTYARFLCRCRWIHLSGVYVKGNTVYRIPRRVLASIIVRLRRIWSGRENPSGSLSIFSNNGFGALMRFCARCFKRVGSASGEGGYYINVSQRNLANRAVIKMIERGKLAAVCVIHDLLPITHGHFFDEHAAVTHDAKLRAVMDMRGIMVCGSMTLAKELKELSGRYGFPAVPVVSSKFGCRRAGRWLQGSPPVSCQPYHVMIATFEPRKNHRFLLEVWREAIDRAGSLEIPQLVMIGRRGSESQFIEKALADDDQLTGKVLLFEGISDLQISAFIANSEAVIIPSIAEGYGLPLYEAFSHGVPVIASDLPVFRELAGSTARLLPVNDLEAWVSSIVDYRASGERLRQQALLHVWQRPTWACHFRQLIAAMKSHPGPDVRD